MGASGDYDPKLVTLSPSTHAADVTVPVLLIHGRDDTVVPYEQSEIMADAMERAGKPVGLVTLRQRRRERNRRRARCVFGNSLWQRVEFAFGSRAMPAAPVLFVDHATALGGAEVGLLVSLGALDRGLFTPHLVTRPGRLAEGAARLGVRLHDAPLARLRGRPDAPWRLARAVNVMADIIRREKIALVVGNTVRASFYAALAAAVTRRPFVWHAQDIFPAGPYVRFMLRASTAVIAISNAVARSLPSAEKVRIIPHGVGLSEFEVDRRAQAVDLRAQWGIPAQAVLLGHVARLQPWKGQRDVVAAAEALRDLEHVYVAIVGGDIFRDARDYEEELRQTVRRRALSGRVIFTGHQDDVPTTMQALDVLVHASDNEPFGRVLIEGGAAALPVAAYASGAVEEIVGHEATGLLVPPSNVAALGAVLRRLAVDGALRQRLGRAGRERVCAEFDARQTTRRIEAVLSAVLDGRRSDRPATSVHARHGAAAD